MFFTNSTQSGAEARKESDICSTSGQSLVRDVVGVGARGSKHHGTTAQS